MSSRTPSASSVAESRSTSLVACVGVMVLSGGIYLFPAISSALAERLSLSNTELQVVGAAGNAGQWLGLVPGIMCDRLGVKRACALGALLNCAGLVCTGLAFQGWLPGHVVLLALYNFVTAQGTCTTYVCSMKATQLNYDAKERGSLVGLLACFFGLSSGLMTFTYKTTFEPFSADLGLFLFMMAAFILTVQFLASRSFSTVLPPPSPQGAVEQKRTQSVFALTVLVLVVQLIAGLTASQIDNAQVKIWLWMMLVLCVLVFPALVLLLWPLYIPLPSSRIESSAAAPTAGEGSPTLPPAHAINGSDGDNNSLSSEREMAELVVHPAASVQQQETSPQVDPVSPVEIPLYDPASQTSPLPPPPSYTLREAMLTANFWLLFSALGGGLAYSVTLLNNLAGITASFADGAQSGDVWDEDQREAFEQHVGALVVLFSSANVTGRLSVGKVAERFQHVLPRLAWTALGCAIGGLGALLLVIAPSSGMLWLAVPLGGVAMGFLFGSAPLSTSDLFGLSSFGTVWGVMVGAPCVSTILVATVAAGRMSDDAAQRSYVVMKDRHFCLGLDCFRGAMGIAFGSAICATVAAVALTRRQQQSTRRADLSS